MNIHQQTPITPNHVSIPSLKAYIERIGAEELHFRKFMVKKYHGTHYYRERCLIKIADDGTITVTDPEFAPTETEAAEIKAALLDCNYPTAIHATNAQFRALRMQQGSSALLYAFYDRQVAADEGNIIMVQERIMINGRKAYIPWTMFSDGDWRRMEPDGDLPFWKPEAPTDHSQFIMIHEGAKVAAYVHDLVNNPESADELGRHPWGKELAGYEHWGLIGGALAPHRTDYSELIRARATEVVYVCDNDWPGKEALKTVSRSYSRALKGVKFDARWKEGWDLANTMPEAMFNAKGEWNGPTLRSLMQPATWATDSIIVDNKKIVTGVRTEFSQEWVHVVKPEVYIHRDHPNTMHTEKEFNHFVRSFSDTSNTAALLKTVNANLGIQLKYSPAVQSGLYIDELGNSCMNTHVPGTIKAKKGNPKPFLRFMQHLIVDDKDRIETLRWCATLIERLDIKMMYGLLLISEVQGVGKSTLGENILGPLVGEHNVSAPSEEEITEGNFNEWASHKRLAIAHEIYAGHSVQAYNKLKSVVTDKTIRVHQKYLARYEIINWLHIFACSNSMNALKLTGDDRRWFVPKLTSEKHKPEYWIEFNN